MCTIRTLPEAGPIATHSSKIHSTGGTSGSLRNGDGRPAPGGPCAHGAVAVKTRSSTRIAAAAAYAERTRMWARSIWRRAKGRMACFYLDC